MNNWSFTGNIGNVKDMHYTEKGQAVIGFSVAVTSGWGDNKKTTWANCTLWGKQAESLSAYIVKDAKIGICGEVTLREWTSADKSGTSLDVRVTDVTLLGGKAEQSNATPDFDDDDFVDF